MWRERVALVGATCGDTKAGMHGVVSSPGPMPGCAPAAGERLRGGGRVALCSFLGAKNCLCTRPVLFCSPLQNVSLYMQPLLYPTRPIPNREQ